jgi:hypothetical protein
VSSTTSSVTPSAIAVARGDVVGDEQVAGDDGSRARGFDQLTNVVRVFGDVRHLPGVAREPREDEHVAVEAPLAIHQTRRQRGREVAGDDLGQPFLRNKAIDQSALLGRQRVAHRGRQGGGEPASLVERLVSRRR